MAIAKEIYKWERVAPVRFKRYTGHPPAGRYAPELDDRGYVNYGGPAVGVCRGDTTRVDLVRAQLDDSAPLFLTVGSPEKLSIIEPGGPVHQLPSGHRAHVDFRAGNADGDVKVHVHAQSANGPVIGQLTVHVSQLMRVHCAIHRTAIYNLPGSRQPANTTNRSFADIRNIISQLNRFWRPMGIEFVADTERESNLTNQVPRDGVNPADGILLCPIYGSNTSNENFTRLMATNAVANRLNLHFVPGIQAANPGGGAAPNYIGFGSSAQHGLVISDNIGDLETTAHTLAHELGHILNLCGCQHANQYDSHSDDDPQFVAAVPSRRHDLWSRRRLMYYSVGLNSDDRVGAGGRYPFAGTNVGYGAGRSGHMITIKNLSQDPTDNENSDARAQAATLH
jgi:hypothetical protein